MIDGFAASSGPALIVWGRPVQRTRSTHAEGLPLSVDVGKVGEVRERRMRSRWAVAGGVALAVALTGCTGGGSSRKPLMVKVSYCALTFSPASAARRNLSVSLARC